MGLGPYLYLLWFAQLVAAIVLASIHFSRRQRSHSLQGLGALIGGILSWAWISAYIGAMELSNYTMSIGFYFSLLLGLAGVTLFGQAWWRLRRKKQHPAT